MPLILSQDHDISSDEVIEYIYYYRGNPKRYNYESGIKDITLSIDNINSCFSYADGQNTQYTSNEFEKFWYRRGAFSFKTPFDIETVSNNEILKYIEIEWNFANAFLFSEYPFIGSYIQETYNNKLINLSCAKKCSFRIPSTILTTSKYEALKFIRKFPKVITKPLHNSPVSYSDEGICYISTGTKIISETDLNKLNDNFCPMLIQEYIEKEIEIRVFFFGENIYPMAIFSQLDDKTKVDFRNYNIEKPNRNIPYCFPNEIQSKLIKLIGNLGLNTGSIDIIIDKNYEYIFLEVNPSGQFDWLSRACNYHIEEDIAKYLIKNERYKK